MVRGRHCHSWQDSQRGDRIGEQACPVSQPSGCEDEHREVYVSSLDQGGVPRSASALSQRHCNCPAKQAAEGNYDAQESAQIPAGSSQEPVCNSKNPLGPPEGNPESVGLAQVDYASQFQVSPVQVWPPFFTHPCRPYPLSCVQLAWTKPLSVVYGHVKS